MGRRVHIVVPETLTDELDELIGKRGRSAFVANLIKRELRRRKFERALELAKGVISDAAYPEWKDSVKWVDDLRAEDNRIQEAKLKNAARRTAVPGIRPQSLL